MPGDFGDEFTIVVSLCSHRVNNAFLFSVRNKNRLQFGVQILPRKLVVYVAEKPSVYFDYNAHNGQWHSFAIAIKGRTATFSADCGEQVISKELPFELPTFVSGSKLTLGRMSLKAVPFEGAICQLDIYPNAQASTNYCNYVKKQCRLTDSYRSPSPSLSTTTLPDVANSSSRDTSSSLSEEIQPKPSSATMSPHATNTQGQEVTDQDKYFGHSLDGGVETNTQRNLLESRVLSPLTPTSTPRFNDTLRLRPSHDTGIDPSTGQAARHQNLKPDTRKSEGPSSREGAELEEDHSEIVTEGGNRENAELSDKDSSLLTALLKLHVGKESLGNVNRPEIEEQISDQLMGIQMINATLYRASKDTLVQNQNAVWAENDDSPLDSDHTIENSHEIDIENYDYDYEDFLDYLVYEGLPGPKGEPGPPVSLSN
ncbi:hypothetical protein scyTo_0024193 [Scyliorhinus torazame]|uniref:Laminin G domain-containing protein n=1 Tax=Scyliorhinus torazame TaxID=75743 RepID=A0A401QEI6_SCYTO|nr:hypothetical protein [Scyliorhinus torazame]